MDALSNLVKLIRLNYLYYHKLQKLIKTNANGKKTRLSMAQLRLDMQNNTLS